MRLFARRHNVVGEAAPEQVDVAAKVKTPPPPAGESERLLAALILHYCQGEARFTEAFLDGLPNVTLEAHTEPDGTLVIRARR